MVSKIFREAVRVMFRKFPSTGRMLAGESDRVFEAKPLEGRGVG